MGAAGSAVVRLLQFAEINDTSAVSISTDGKLDLNNFNETIGSLFSGFSTSSVTLGAGTLTTDGDNRSMAEGRIQSTKSTKGTKYPASFSCL